MRRKLRRGYIALALMMATVGLFALTMLSPVLSTTTDFSIYNSGWNGTSNLAVSTYELGNFAPTLATQATGTDVTIAHLNLQELDIDPATDTLMILGPSKPFSSSDGDLVRSFVTGGGILVLADDFGTGNGLLQAMGANSRFSGKLLMDLSFDRRPEFSVCFNFADGDPLTTDLSKILLNHPSSVTVSDPNTTVIAESSIASWLDSDGDSTRDVGEPKGPFPIMAKEDLGDGTIILLSDPSVLINGMATQLDNGILAANLVSVACDQRVSVFFDESHREYFDPVVVATQVTDEMSFATKMHIMSVAFVLLLWVATDLIDRGVLWIVRLVRSFQRAILRLLGRRLPEAETGPVKTPEELLREVSERHPEWRLGLLRHVMSERERHGEYVRKAVTRARPDGETPPSETVD
jgi:hypothetical protein